MKRTNKLISLLILIFIILILSFQTVFAWGILPARQLANLNTNQQDLSLTIKNTNLDDGFFQIEFAGSLANYAVYSGQLIHLSVDKSEEKVYFTLTLPDDLEPGKQTLKVILREIDAQGNSATVNSLLSLVGEVVVNVPYEGNYISAQVYIDTVPSTEATPITVSLVNKGDDAVPVFVDIVIKSPTNTVLSQWSTSSTIINYLGVGKIETSWSGSKVQGVYLAEIMVHYGDKTKVLTKKFAVGTKEIISLDLTSDNFILGDIAPLNVVAFNEWNEEVSNVYADVFVLSKEGQLVQRFKTLSETISSHSKKLLLGYWDTSNLLVGEYDLNVLMYYAGGQTQKQYSVVVSMDKLSVLNGISGNVVEDVKSTEKSQYSLFIILLLVLIISNVIIIVYFKRIKNSGGNKL